MTSPAEAIGLEPDSDSLTPLPALLRAGLTAVSVLASVSFASSALVLLYLTYKLARWHLTSGDGTNHGGPAAVDLSLGLAERHFGHGDDGDGHGDAHRKRKGSSPNQFLVLIFNLLLADMAQASAFLLNTTWLTRDAVQVGTRTCFAQGWLVSVGDLASSLFIGAIAVHTYLTVVWEYKPRQWVLYFAIAGIWIFVHLISAIGIIATKNGEDNGGYYVRAAAWVREPQSQSLAFADHLWC